MATEKLSATVDAELLKGVRTRAGTRGLSAFVARALRRELDNVNLREFLDELEAEIGPPDKAMVTEAHALLDTLETPSENPRVSKAQPREPQT